MEYKYYIVTFNNGKTVFVNCFNREEAEILAKAIMINNGFTREIVSITETHSTAMEVCDFINRRRTNKNDEITL